MKTLSDRDVLDVLVRCTKEGLSASVFVSSVVRADDIEYSRVTSESINAVCVCVCIKASVVTYVCVQLVAEQQVLWL